MNATALRGASVLVTGALVACTMLPCSLAQQSFAEQITETADAALRAEAAASAVAPSKKEETVKVRTDAYGAAQETSVSVNLQNSTEAAELSDETRLVDVEADDEDQTFTDTDGVLVWETQGKDVSYTGTSDASLPLEMQISYTLDGADIAAEDLVGKSGALNITYRFTNTSGTGSNIVPFVCISGISLPQDTFTNVEIDNGTIMSSSGSVVALGIALPGVQAALGLSGSEVSSIEIPESFTIRADVENFSLGESVTYVSSDLLNDFDTSSLSFGDMTEGMDSLQSAMNTLISGSDTLANAASALAQGNAALDSGLGQLQASTSSLPEAMQSLSAGATAVSDGLAAAVQSTQALNEAAGSLASTSQDVANQASSVASALSGAQSTLGALSAQSGTLSAQRDALRVAINNLDQDTNADLIANLNAAIRAIDEAQSAISTAQNSLPDASALTSEADSAAAAAAGVSGGLSGLVGSAGDASTQASGLVALAGGASQVAEGTAQLEASSSSLVSGIAQLKSGSEQLVSGTAATASGTKEFSSGLQQFNDQGIAQLTEVFSDTLGGLSDKLATLQQNGKRYTNFSGITDGTEGSVMFMYQNPALEAA